MSASRAVLIAAACVAEAHASDGDAIRILVAGDVLLSRQVRGELARTGRDPWWELRPLLSGADLVLGNLEGAVGSSEGCVEPGTTCFAIDPEVVPLLAAAGFDALSLENNHAADLGESARAATRSALGDAGLVALTRDAPAFVDVRGTTVGLVAATLVPGRDGQAETVPSVALGQRLRLARALADVVVVTIHWGNELQDWPSAGQRRAAEWIVAQGADLVVGHHPHVVQPVECVGGRPVFFSVGNHVFDQKYPDAKRGWIADCTVDTGGVSCRAVVTEASAGTSRPRPVGDAPEVQRALEACGCRRGGPLQVSGVELRGATREGGVALRGRRAGGTFQTAPGPVLAASALPLTGGEEVLFTLELRPSPLDGEIAPRPYVYRLADSGPVALWRGSGLAWPLLDARPMPGVPGVLCALHRGDSFLLPSPQTPRVRVAAYRWNGFGFSGEEGSLLGRCEEILAP